MHIMTTRNQRGSEWNGLVQSYWDPESQQTRKRIIASLAGVPKPLIAAMKAELQRQRHGKTGVAMAAETDVGTVQAHGGVSAVLRMAEQLGLPRILSRHPHPHRDRVLAMLVARVLEPGSKLGVERALAADGRTTLAAVLGVPDTAVDSLYAALDWLADRQPTVERALARRHLQDGTLVLYDVSSSYFEGDSCPLAAHGYSRDHRPDRPQLVYGLLCTADGCPVAVSTFPGNTADPATVSTPVARLRRQYHLRNVAVVGDRGMLTSARIREDLVPAGFDWITALRAPALQQLIADGTLPPSRFDEHGLATVTSEHYPGERLIVCRNPILADRRHRHREALLAKAEAHIQTCAAMYARGRLGRDACNRRLGKICNWKMQKHFRFTFDPDVRTLTWVRDEESIAAEAATDGLYVVRTSLPATRLDAPDTVRAYKDLQHVELAFRTWKSMLQVRPIRHYHEKRVRGHLFLCMLAYYVTWHLRRALRPMLFADPEPAASPSPVGPRTRSARARRRESRRRAEDGIPLYPLAELLRRLDTLVVITERIPGALGGGEVRRLSGADPWVRRVFELLNCRPHLPPAFVPLDSGSDAGLPAGGVTPMPVGGKGGIWRKNDSEDRLTTRSTQPVPPPRTQQERSRPRHNRSRVICGVHQCTGG